MSSERNTAGAGKRQWCNHCGDEVFEPLHDWRDGPLCCGALACVRAEQEDARAAQEEAADRAAEDGYSLYGGGRR